MATDNQNAESLHDVGKGTTSPTSPAFVNKGTPEKPLAQLSDLENPEVSTAGSQALRDGLIKDKK